MDMAVREQFKQASAVVDPRPLAIEARGLVKSFDGTRCA
jgi:hypothetical protein